MPLSGAPLKCYRIPSGVRYQATVRWLPTVYKTKGTVQTEI
jgi:hypothetical protein